MVNGAQLLPAALFAGLPRAASPDENVKPFDLCSTADQPLLATTAWSTLRTAVTTPMRGGCTLVRRLFALVFLLGVSV